MDIKCAKDQDSWVRHGKWTEQLQIIYSEKKWVDDFVYVSRKFNKGKKNNGGTKDVEMLAGR